jgi:hypothetical protein
MKTPLQDLIEEARYRIRDLRRIGWDRTADMVASLIHAVEHLDGTPEPEPMNPYRPETELVRVPREDEETPADPRVVERVVKPGERTRMDRKGVGEQ